MVKHIVMWSYENKEDIAIAKEQLESMRGHVPTMLSLEVGVNFSGSPAACDLVLITTHRDRASLKAYQNDARHVRVKEVLGGLRSQRCVADYEIVDCKIS